jgi:hypothetical protein
VPRSWTRSSGLTDAGGLALALPDNEPQPADAIWLSPIAAVGVPW